ncbi:putative LRR receptor-like serine/threonine-protein kinase [Forsythia ovata]|uniref:LRR receptor-like serine/threonine-protein kinase n=1 Tax=Forsythia ovata TaxID=205694 RepID=A0ABD1WVZ6_9LAMI
MIVSNNNFYGFIPDGMGKLSQLREIETQYNELNGAIPPRNLTIFNISSLLQISIRVNKIFEKFPEDPCNRLTMLEFLQLSDNKFHGEMPPSLLQCNALYKLLDLSYNDFTDFVFVFTQQSLYLGGNRLSGETPGNISNFSKLTTLDLSPNSFSGRVLINLGNLQDLQIIYNQLTNDPSMLELDFLISLKNCRHLKKIQIDSNSFDGMLPKALGNLSACVKIFIAYSSGIKGMIPNEVGIMGNLIELCMEAMN